MKNLKPLIFWSGFPVVGLITKDVVKKYKESLIFLSNPSEMPYKDLEKKLGHKIVWLEKPEDIWERRNEFDDRNLIIHTGWNWKEWLKFDLFMKKRGAKIVLASDNCFKANLRQLLGAIYFRLFLRKYFDAVIVPGKSGVRFLSFLGMPRKRIYTGLLGCDSDIYNTRALPKTREDEFLFVGQLIHRKGIDLLIKAFLKYKKDGGKYQLRIIGEGAMRSMCEGHDGIIVESFMQPVDVAKKMKNAKALVLPSREDHWPTVVHESASCGALLIVSKFCGNHHDLLVDGINGRLLKKLDYKELVKIFHDIASWDNEKVSTGTKKSVELASHFCRDRYARTFEHIVNDLIS